MAFAIDAPPTLLVQDDQPHNDVLRPLGGLATEMSLTDPGWFMFAVSPRSHALSFRNEDQLHVRGRHQLFARSPGCIIMSHLCPRKGLHQGRV